MEVKFTVDGEPKGKQRPRVSVKNGFAKAYTPKQTVIYENLVRYTYSSEVGEKLNGEIEATIIGYFPIPKSTSKKERERMLTGKVLHTKKIDCDNLAKIILDSLNEVAYDDDKQVCRLMVEKRYSEQPRVEIILREVEHDGE